jgi:uncharacterized protein (UPF0332 family)
LISYIYLWYKTKQPFQAEGILIPQYRQALPVTAILHKKNIEAKTHTGVRLMLHKILVKESLMKKEDAFFYNNIFEYRHSTDYDEFLEFEKNEAEILLKEATLFISNCTIFLNNN